MVLPPAPLPLLPLDRARVRVLVRNLVDNAIRHGASGSAPPRVELHAESRTAVRIAVRDFGPGVDESQLAHLTEPFFRTDAARARATGGVGLGMYLCRLIAQAHGGELSIANAHPGLRAEARLTG
jgi:signal transduction histidine kinase